MKKFPSQALTLPYFTRIYYYTVQEKTGSGENR